jgi:hypothetical protein
MTKPIIMTIGDLPTLFLSSSLMHYFPIYKPKNLIYFTAVALIAAMFVFGCGKLKHTAPDVRFTFIGDVHYKIPDYTITDYFVPQVAKELSQLSPKSEFALLTGDFYHGLKETDIEAEAAFAFKHFSENIGIPFYVAIGNHDTREPFLKNALPIYSKELDREITSTYFSFNRGNCHFVLLDCMLEDLTEQLSWLENDLQKASLSPEIEHIFVAGHYPLWIVARAGFTLPEYAEPVSKLLAKYKIDAYFCGHTHNHTSTVKIVEGTPLTQIMGAAVVEEGRMFNLAPFLNHVRKAPKNIQRPGMVRLEETYQIFIPESKQKYYWGYQEGTTSCYFVVTVHGKTVQVDYHLLGQDAIRSYKWDRPGEIVDLITPAVKTGVELTENDFSHIKKAWLYAAPWTEQETVTATVKINGVDAGELDMSREAVAYSPFWNKIEVPLDNSVITALQKKNIIRISNPKRWEFGLAHIFILIQFDDGRFAKSTLSPFVLTSFKIEQKGNYFPASELIHCVAKGEDLEEVTLIFDNSYHELASME